MCKHFSNDLVNEHSNMPRRGVIPKFSDLEVIALALTADTESIDSERCQRSDFGVLVLAARVGMRAAAATAAATTLATRHPHHTAHSEENGHRNY